MQSFQNKIFPIKIFPAVAATAAPPPTLPSSWALGRRADAMVPSHRPKGQILISVVRDYGRVISVQ